MAQDLDRVYTIPLGKVLLSPDNQRAKRAINMIREFARRHMKINDVRIDEEVAQAVWSRGMRRPPRKIRVRMERTEEKHILIKKYDETDAEAGGGGGREAGADAAGGTDGDEAGSGTKTIGAAMTADGKMVPLTVPSAAALPGATDEEKAEAVGKAIDGVKNMTPEEVKAAAVDVGVDSETVKMLAEVADEKTAEEEDGGGLEAGEDEDKDEDGGDDGLEAKAGDGDAAGGDAKDGSGSDPASAKADGDSSSNSNDSPDDSGDAPAKS